MSASEEQYVTYGRADAAANQEEQLLSELSQLLKRPQSEVESWWRLAKETGYCLHCSNIYLRPFLDSKSLCIYDTTLCRPNYSCNCELKG